jgi:hypothetical protein
MKPRVMILTLFCQPSYLKNMVSLCLISINTYPVSTYILLVISMKVSQSRRYTVQNKELRYILLYFFTGSSAPFGPGLCFFSFMIILHTVGLLGRVINSSQDLYRNTEQHKHRKNTYTYQTSMLCVGFEPTIPASERAKAVHALDRSATVTGI